MVRACHAFRKWCFIMKFINQEKVNCFCEKVIRRYYSLNRKNDVGINKEVVRSRELIVSLTTIPSRIDSVYLTVESMLRQTYKPDKIILWLAEDEFHNVALPNNLLKQSKRGLEIRYCENLKSHKKYYETMRQFPQALLVTIDDDIFYSERLLENLVRAYVRNPACIICSGAHLVKYKRKKEPECYNNWASFHTWSQFFPKEKISYDFSHESIFFTSGSGTLIPVWKMPKECLDKNLAMCLCPTADDVWLNYMARITNTKIVPLRSVDGWFIYMVDAQKSCLSDVNLGIGEQSNDAQLEKMYERFGFYI